jgi:PAS domain S-box-containing protein
MGHASYPAGRHGPRDRGTEKNEGSCRFAPDSRELPDFQSIVNIPELQDMMNYFYELTHVGMAITDMNGNVLVATGWQDICTQFHRCHPQTLKNCIESDTYITKNPVKGEFMLYKCKNNMWDMATPLFVGDRHVANLFLGQFFFDDEVLDHDFFRAQAERYGFDVEEYLAALDRTPRWSRDKVRTAMEFYVRLAGMINTLSYSNVQLQHTLGEQRKSEEALQDNERKCRAIFDQTFQYTGLMTPDGILIEANRSALMLIGAAEPEVIGKPFWVTPWWTHSKGMQRKLRQAVKKAAGGEFVRFEATHRAADGGLRYIDFSIKPVRDETGCVVMLIPEGRDITERKRTEKALQFERSQLLSIFDSIDEVIYISDPYTYEILYANRAMQEKFGKDLIGGTCYREFQGKDAPCEFCTNHLILKNKDVPYRWEFHNATVDRDFLIVDRIIKWPDGRDVRFELAIDITGRKRMEMDLKDAKARAELYLDVMGHDINNMHQIALGYLELARNMSQDVCQQELLDIPVEVLQRSARIIQNVRKLQKLQEGAFQAGRVDACQLLASVQREYAALPGKAITLDLKGHEHCYVLANELLYDVFANLVGNAIKHTGDRADIAVNLEVTGGNDDRYCLITVEDDGPGIPDDFKDRIFNRMLKGTDKAKGMGLGLFLVKSLVESYDGRVWVEDRVPGDHRKGAKFVVRLPVAG